MKRAIHEVGEAYASTRECDGTFDWVELNSSIMARIIRGDDRHCWHWDNKNEDKRPVITLNGAAIAVARIIAAINLGPLKPRSIICHRCDNAWCVNPSHLYEGTQTTNIADHHALRRLAPAAPPAFIALETIGKMMGELAKTVGPEWERAKDYFGVKTTTWAKKRARRCLVGWWRATPKKRKAFTIAMGGDYDALMRIATAEFDQGANSHGHHKRRYRNGLRAQVGNPRGLVEGCAGMMNPEEAYGGGARLKWTPEAPTKSCLALYQESPCSVVYAGRVHSFRGAWFFTGISAGGHSISDSIDYPGSRWRPIHEPSE